MGAFDFLRTDRNLPGYWDPVNSTIDWCELNYVYTFYIAELWNTLTNVPFILGGAWMAYRFAKNGIPWRYVWVHIGGMMIGIGSFGFHCTLQWAWQLLDEFPMVRCSCCLY